jgi:hypothetical protein
MDVTLAFMDKAVICVSSQSGGTHLGLQAMCPSWIMGHEKHRHSVLQNPLKIPCTFMEIPMPYVVPPQEVYKSVVEFFQVVKEQLHVKRVQSITKGEFTNGVACTICGGGLVGPIFKDLFQCSNCGTYKKEQIPSKESILEGLKDFMLGYTSNNEALEERTKEAELQLSVIGKFKNVGKLFDVGCGAGLFMKVARDKGWEVDGNDLSVSAVQYGRNSLKVGIRCGFLEELSIDNDFDVFVLWHTLEHCINPVDTLNCCYNHLKADGIIQIAVPIKRNIHELSSRYEEMHFWEFSKAGLQLLMDKCGFAIIDMQERAPNGDFQINVIGRKK